VDEDVKEVVHVSPESYVHVERHVQISLSRVVCDGFDVFFLFVAPPLRQLFHVAEMLGEVVDSFRVERPVAVWSLEHGFDYFVHVCPGCVWVLADVPFYLFDALLVLGVRKMRAVCMTSSSNGHQSSDS
jgi:hypothetical protein